MVKILDRIFEFIFWFSLGALAGQGLNILITYIGGMFQ